MDSSNPRHHKVPYLSIVLSVCLFVAVAVVAINALRTKQNQLSPLVSETQVVSPAPLPTYPRVDAYFTPVVAPPVAPEEKWQVYTNSTLGISLRHPPDWFFNEEPGSSGASAIFSTPINNPSAQNWRMGELAGGAIWSHKLGNDETLNSYIQQLKIQQSIVWADSKQTGTITVGNKKGLILEGPEPLSIAVFVENNGVAYIFNIGTTYQNDKSNDKMYRQIFERVLSTVTFSN